MMIAQWTGNAPSTGEVAFVTGSTASATEVKLSRVNKDGVPQSLIGLFRIGDKIHIANSSDCRKFAVSQITSQLGSDENHIYFGITPLFAGPLYPGDIVLVTRLPQGIGDVTGTIPSTITPFDSILTDGSNVLVGAGNVLTT